MPVTPSNIKIAGTVILYQPDCGLIDRLKSYLDDIEVLYVIDNSEQQQSVLLDDLERMEKVRYLPNGQNRGIAAALNQAAEKAVADGYDFLLTMDQDSSATENMISAMLECLEAGAADKVGIISPFHLVYKDWLPDQEIACREVPFVMTSGNLLNLAIYRKNGSFLEKLFIDGVDYDYCLRLTANGYKIIQSNRAILYHSLGSTGAFSFFGKTLVTSNHSPLRRYYNTRNRFYLWQTYGESAEEVVRRDKGNFIGEIRNIIFGEKERLAKVRMMIKGYLDYKRGKFGKFEP